MKLVKIKKAEISCRKSLPECRIIIITEDDREEDETGVYPNMPDSISTDVILKQMIELLQEQISLGGAKEEDAEKSKVETYLLVDDLHHPAERFGQKEAR